MVQTIPARDITLHDLETKFGLTLVENDQFFREWQDNLLEITDLEKQRLDRVKASYSHLLKYPPLLENTLKKAEEGRQKAEGSVQTGIQTPPEREPVNGVHRELDTLTLSGCNSGCKLIAKAFLPPSAFCPLPFLVKMVVLSPLLDLADFYLPPFHIKSEKAVEISAEDDGLIVRGEMDVLTLFEQLWVLVIESKKAAFSLEVGRPQILAYMMANPTLEKPIYGLITNGASFIFLKLVKQPTPQYAFSRLFYIFNPGNDLYNVLRVLKRLGQLATSSTNGTS